MKLRDCYYREHDRLVVTAHRGFSGKFPENTITAFSEAVRIGVDIVEFDVRETSDGELVVIHDISVDRTTDGTGMVESLTLSELKRLNATFWTGPHDTGRRLDKPSGTDTIPTFAETLTALAGQVALNIQVYVRSATALRKIVGMYEEHNLTDTAFLMVDSFATAQQVRLLPRAVALCVGEAREDLSRHMAFGVDFIQPTKHCLSATLAREITANRLRANVFYANTRQDMQALVQMGMPGIMTDEPALLLELLDQRNF